MPPGTRRSPSSKRSTVRILRSTSRDGRRGLPCLATRPGAGYGRNLDANSRSRTPVRLRPASIAACVVLAAACTQEPEFDLPTVALTPRAESPSATSSPAGPLTRAPGRIVVIDEAGNLVVVDPDGSDPVVLAESIPGESIVQQPTWSPDGDRIAW